MAVCKKTCKNPMRIAPSRKLIFGKNLVLVETQVCKEKEFLIYKLVALPGVPKKYRRLINNRTKVFCLIFRISSILNKTYPYLDFEIKIVEIR